MVHAAVGVNAEARDMFTIGQVAARAKTSADSIRFYEREGLIAPAARSPAGYRLYTDEAVRRLAFVRHAQECGFALSEVKELLDLRRDTRACCDDVYRVAVEKKLQLEAKIRALKTMSDALSGLIEACSHDAKPLDDCPILGALESSLAEARAARTDSVAA
jgi:DNA-binding transcriptional MerR regulator